MRKRTTEMIKRTTEMRKRTHRQIIVQYIKKFRDEGMGPRQAQHNARFIAALIKGVDKGD